MTSYKEDIYEDSKEFLKYACDMLYNDDFYEMKLSVLEIDTGDCGIGDCVRLVEDLEREAAVNRSRRFCDNYMRVFNGGFTDWALVRAEATPDAIKLFFLRFGGEDGLCDGYEALRLKYPKHIKIRITVGRDDGSGKHFLIDAVGNGEDKPGTVIIEEYCGNELICTRRLAEDERGIYALVSEREPGNDRRE